MPPALRVLLAGALFSTGGAFIKLCDFPSLQRAGVRSALAALAIFVLLPAARRLPSRRVLLLTVPYFGSTCFFVVANSLTTAANAIFLQCAYPLWVAVLGPLLLREPLHRRDFVTMAGIAVGMALFFVAPQAESATAPDPRLGDVLAIATGVSFALLLLGMRHLARAGRDEAPAVIAWGNVVTTPLAFLLMPLVGQTPIAGDASSWLTIAYLGVFQVGIAYAVLVRALPHVPAVRASLLLMIEPALNPLIAFVFVGERPHALAIAGGGVILASVLLGMLRRG
ncbi:MAG: DMT family transporter [Planctomycetota bacterium]